MQRICAPAKVRERRVLLCLLLRRMTTLGLALALAADRRAETCPLCFKTIYFTGAVTAVSQHAASPDCTPDSPKVAANPLICAAPSCHAQLTLSDKVHNCPICGQQTCMAHRYTDQHTCRVQPADVVRPKHPDSGWVPSRIWWLLGLGSGCRAAPLPAPPARLAALPRVAAPVRKTALARKATRARLAASAPALGPRPSCVNGPQPSSVKPQLLVSPDNAPKTAGKRKRNEEGSIQMDFVAAAALPPLHVLSSASAEEGGGAVTSEVTHPSNGLGTSSGAGHTEAPHSAAVVGVDPPGIPQAVGPTACEASVLDGEGGRSTCERCGARSHRTAVCDCRTKLHHAEAQQQDSICTVS